MNIVQRYLDSKSKEKEYKCPICFVVSSASAWFNATEKSFGQGITSLEYCKDYEKVSILEYNLFDHNCPSCNHCSYAKDIEEI
jgi:hypothetical protein